MIRLLPPLVASLVLFTSLALAPAMAPLPSAARTLSILAIVLSLLVALFVRKPEIRSRASVAFALAGGTAAGQALIGAPYAVITTALAMACLLSMRTARAAVLRPAGTLRARPLVVFFGVAVAVFTLLASSLPPASVRIERYAIHAFGSRLHTMGFSSTLHLGEMREMMDSPRPVLEVEGEHVDYLRGAVLDQFDRHTWRTSDRLRFARPVEAILPRPNGTTRLSFVPGARVLRDERARFFVPFPSCRYGNASGKVAVDSGGVVYPSATGDESIWFETRGCGAPPFLGPDAQDVAVPRSSFAELQRISRSWTLDAPTTRAKLVALERELGRFEYSLAYQEMLGAEDPVIDFLVYRKKGYCEQFASAMVLLARAEGIPARVVTGYRVPLPGALSGRMIVRERNAHAWVEAWVDGAWHGFDPTPRSEGFGAQERLEDAGDWASSLLDRGWDAVGRLDVVDTTILLGALVVAFFLVRRFGAGFRRKRRRAGDNGPALACFDTLSETLARGGLTRSDSEPIEGFAQRLRAHDEPWTEHVADALVRYAALRYGGVGNEREIVAAVEAAAERVPTSWRAARADGS